MTSQEFVDWLAPQCQAICESVDLPWQVCVAQAIQETGYGQAKIGEFNLWGRKWGHWGRAINVKTQECYDGQNFTDEEDLFQDYDSLEQAISDWCNLMEWGPYLPTTTQYHADHEIGAFIDGIGAVYATDPEYARSVRRLVREWFDVAC